MGKTTGSIKSQPRFSKWNTNCLEVKLKVSRPWGCGSELIITLLIIAYSQSAWEEMDAGHYEFPFALKVRSLASSMVVGSVTD
jgi:hypothetical protein